MRISDWSSDVCSSDLLRSGVTNTSANQIATLAGVTRGTFYLHYRGKDAILLDLIRKNRQPQSRQMERLRDLDPLTLQGVRGWLMACVTMIRQRQDQLQLFNLATAYDSDARREIIDQRLESIRLLGMRYPRFDISQGSEQDRKEIGRAHV